MKSLHDLFCHELADIYDAEQRIAEALPDMAEAASDSELSEGFKTHLKETKQQIKRIERVYDLLDMEPEKESCDAIQGLLKEGEEIIDEVEDKEVLDAALIVAAQKIEHYEIASYGSLCALARTLNLNEVADLLEETLQEEKDTDEKLTMLAETHVNADAAQRAA